LTLEIAAGTRIATDGGSGPDVWILIDDARSGPYRADVGVDRHPYTTVGSALIGSLPLDADQFGITRIRYVRIKNRGTRPLYLDAVGAARTVPASPKRAPASSRAANIGDRDRPGRPSVRRRCRSSGGNAHCPP